jgi:hypothetical protein
VILDKPRRGWKGSRYKDEAHAEEASKVFNIRAQFNYLNPQYELEILQDNTIDEQGLLAVGTLKPRQQGLPQFTIRWDEKGNHLNIDMNPPDKDWEREKNGFKGHLPQKTQQLPGRAFALIIQTPSLSVIDAAISFNLAFDVRDRVTIGVSTGATDQLEHPK